MLQQPDSFPPNPSDSGQVPSSRSGLLWWLVAVCLAVVLHLLIGYALFVAALPCAQAAWKSFRCGFWLRRSDPNAARGRACWWFYIAVGFWKAAATAFVFVLILLAIDLWIAYLEEPHPGPAPEARRAREVQRARREPIWKELNATALIVPVGAGLATLVGIIATAIAFRGKVRVWADPGLRASCRGEFRRLSRYVLSPGSRRQVNPAIIVLAMSVVLLPPCLGTGFLCWYGYNHPKDAQTLPQVFGFLMLFPTPLLMIPVYAFLSSRIIARAPAECWPPAELIGRAIARVSSYTSTPGPDAPRR